MLCLFYVALSVSLTLARMYVVMIDRHIEAVPQLRMGLTLTHHYARRFDDVGLILCSSTRLEDVPCADAFSVEDTLVVSTTETVDCGGLRS